MIGSASYIDFEDRRAHQETIDEFFRANVSESRSLLIDTQDASLSFKVNAEQGEIRFTILGNHEKDYHFFSEEITKEPVLEEIRDYLCEKRVDNIKIPLLSEQGAKDLQKQLSKALPNYLFHTNVSSVCLIVDTDEFSKSPQKYTRPIKKYRKRGAEFVEIDSFHPRIRRLHEKRWGANRSDDFYDYLSYMNENDLSRGVGLFLDGELISYVQVIVTGDTSHYYYSIYHSDYDSAGSATVNYALQTALEDTNTNYYSYGRGAEMYKHRWATDMVVNYEVRGFLEERF